MVSMSAAKSEGSGITHDSSSFTLYDIFQYNRTTRVGAVCGNITELGVVGDHLSPEGKDDPRPTQTK